MSPRGEADPKGTVVVDAAVIDGDVARAAHDDASLVAIEVALADRDIVRAGA